MNAADTTAPAACRRLRFSGWFALLGLAAALAVTSVHLWPEWRRNPDLSHGLFVPALFLVLLHEARGGTRRYGRGTLGCVVVVALLLVAGLLALSAGGLYAAAVDWSHPLVSLMLTLALTLFLAAGLIVFAHGSVRLVPLNWSSAAAVLLWLLAVPIPPGTYARLSLGLQLWLSEGVLRTLHLLGIAAIRHGNIIELAQASVGVEEACSGIRSLISCVFAGVVFSATLVRRPLARALVIALAAPLAIGMNFLRSLTLTLLANRGVDIAGFWHDVTGFAVLGVTAALLAGIALVLSRHHRARPPATPIVSARAAASLQRVLAAGGAAAAALALFFVLNTRAAPHRDGPAPDVLALLPPAVDGWQVKTTDLYEFSGTLRTEHLAQRHYLHDTPARRTEIVLYVAHWRAGQAPVSLVAAHTPDACWPGSGWTALPRPETRARLRAADREIAEAEYRVFQAGDRPQHVWFWHLHGGRAIRYGDPYSPRELLRLAWRFGFRRDGDQWFVRVSSDRPWEEIAHEPVFAEFFARTRALGL